MPELTDIHYVRNIMEKYGFHMSKSLGQNFLINPTVCPRIAEYGNAKPDFGILEIGTGVGVLTKELAIRADKVVAIELDQKLFPILEETLAGFENIKIIHGDVMTYDLEKLIQEEFLTKNIRNIAVCANLPYYITSPVIMRLLEENSAKHLNLSSITVMVQKEAAQRICAPVGSRASGAVTVAVAYYGKAVKLFDVSRGSFLPSPNVDSSVMQIVVYPENSVNSESMRDQVQDERLFFRMVKTGFSQRRKQLAGVLCNAFAIPKSETLEIFAKAKIAPSVRIEALTMAELIRLS
ncbi:MAG: 16S rRNA (adenine(1518)-N(6)/adenine(1519)-N(6))-dimethyltransferase RsmA, partial [Oscillospiraceae bacterium]|nr:16S rRNA (adenine(1518)-N(6)/adenine(1519)-N(6))-dimethyltransferase RsmA [Oscillospiraceae bacterium]